MKNQLFIHLRQVEFLQTINEGNNVCTYILHKKIEYFP
jgi:hypothetical protein